MLLPVNLRVQGRRCVIVGGGAVARRKCLKLAGHGARVTVVAPELAGADDPAWRLPDVTILRQAYATGVLKGAFLAIAATDDPAVNARVAADAEAAGILCQRVDRPDAGDFSLPATLRRGAMSVSFSTDGAMPALAAKLKAGAEASGVYDAAYGELCRLAESIRREPWWPAMERARRMDAMERMARCGALELLRAGRMDDARELLVATARGKAPETPGGEGESESAEPGAGQSNGARKGKVYLIGAGPGDAGLITVKGAQCLAKADVVLFDAHANPELMDLYCPRAERIDVSKHKGSCRRTQDETNALLVHLAGSGRVVARLKGGDPLVFGRGGEEARALKARGVPFEIVPGVTSAIAAPAYAGIPVTDRAYASSVGIYSMHKREGAGLTDDEWRRMAQGPDTLVLLMGVSVLPAIVEKLMQFGRPGSTPVALVTQGTRPGQARCLATLETLRAAIEGHPIEGPGVIVVGDVAGAAPAMDWFPCRVFGGPAGEKTAAAMKNVNSNDNEKSNDNSNAEAAS